MLKQLIRQIKLSMGIFESNGDTTYGVLAEFSNPGTLLDAARETRKAGYRYFDTHTPFPVHGMDKAMGLGQSIIGPLVFGGALAGLALAVWMQWWMGAIDYPLNISGKPFFSTEPSSPIMFEVTILFSALTAVAAMLALNGLPRPYNPLFYSDNFRRATDDGFFLHIGANDGQFETERVRDFLESIGGYNIEVIEDRETATATSE